ncbi:MAG: T9SS type A sorting domain-containing protein [Bacteroidia bacterium]|nr:T9SS type A sorting domain-containing protein [Bacteroidia bacterium]
MTPKHFLTAFSAVFILGFSTVFAQVSEKSSQFRNNEIQRVRVDFETPMGFVRHLLLGFTPDNSATDGFDYGYDAANIEDLPDDLNWMIENERYVIQGVGAFDDTKMYPFGLFLENSGTVKFSLLALENFAQPIEVYIYDMTTDSYHNINGAKYIVELDPAEYINRYYIAFKDLNQAEENLSLDDYYSRFIRLKFNRLNNLLHIDTQDIFLVNKLEIYDTIGKKLLAFKTTNSSTLELQLNNLQSNFLILKFETSVGVIYKRIMI